MHPTWLLASHFIGSGERFELPSRESRNHFAAVTGHSVRPGSGAFADRIVTGYTGLEASFEGNSSARRFVERTAKLFDKGASGRRIGKAPAIVASLVPPNGTSKSRRDAARLVKSDNLTVQFDI